MCVHCAASKVTHFARKTSVYNKVDTVPVNHCARRSVDNMFGTWRVGDDGFWNDRRGGARVVKFWDYSKARTEGWRMSRVWDRHQARSLP